MTKKKEKELHEYQIEVEVNYQATERGDFTVEAENREEAEEIALDDAKEFRTNNGQIVGCEGYYDGDFSISSIERTDGKDVDGDDDDEEDEDE